MDKICLQPNAFFCNASECISPDKMCDGFPDCGNGRDEVVEVCRELLVISIRVILVRPLVFLLIKSKWSTNSMNTLLMLVLN